MHCCVIGLCGESEKSHDWRSWAIHIAEFITKRRQLRRTQEENTLLDKA